MGVHAADAAAIPCARKDRPVRLRRGAELVAAVSERRATRGDRCRASSSNPTTASSSRAAARSSCRHRSRPTTWVSSARFARRSTRLTTKCSGCLRIVDSSGKVLEIWSQWDRLFQGTNGPHKIKISPYDPRASRVGRRRNEERHLRVLERRQAAPEDARRRGRHRRRRDPFRHSRRTSRFFRTAACSSPTVSPTRASSSSTRTASSSRRGAGKGTGDGQFNTVHGIDVDRNGHIYVVDRLNKRVQVFDANGKHLANWPNIRFPNHVQVTDPAPGDTSTNGEQVVWVADNRPTDVLKFDTKGNHLFSWNASGPVPGGFGELHQFSLDSNGNCLHRRQRPWPSAEARTEGECGSAALDRAVGQADPEVELRASFKIFRGSCRRRNTFTAGDRGYWRRGGRGGLIASERRGATGPAATVRVRSQRPARQRTLAISVRQQRSRPTPRDTVNPTRLVWWRSVPHARIPALAHSCITSL